MKKQIKKCVLCILLVVVFSYTLLSSLFVSATSGKICMHSYGAWKTVAAVCKSKKANECGVEARSCGLCGHTELRDLADIGHNYAAEYTVDCAATGSASGSLSRHCIRCNSTTDRISFSVKDANAKGFRNIVGEKVTK
ncbi:MAG: hypothetical protein MJ132_06260, partial [Clostridia bacterium]|nr:hypothetical protein [Clostridia bacterium]